jgi:hypothetical protein
MALEIAEFQYIPLRERETSPGRFAWEDLAAIGAPGVMLTLAYFIV